MLCPIYPDAHYESHVRRCHTDCLVTCGDEPTLDIGLPVDDADWALWGKSLHSWYAICPTAVDIVGSIPREHHTDVTVLVDGIYRRLHLAKEAVAWTMKDYIQSPRTNEVEETARPPTHTIPQPELALLDNECAERHYVGLASPPSNRPHPPVDQGNRQHTPGAISTTTPPATVEREASAPMANAHHVGRSGMEVHQEDTMKARSPRPPSLVTLGAKEAASELLQSSVSSPFAFTTRWMTREQVTQSPLAKVPITVIFVGNLELNSAEEDSYSSAHYLDWTAPLALVLEVKKVFPLLIHIVREEGYLACVRVWEVVSAVRLLHAMHTR